MEPADQFLCLFMPSRFYELGRGRLDIAPILLGDGTARDDVLPGLLMVR